MLAIATMPDDPPDWPRWLDEQLVGDRLGDVVDELTALGTARTPEKSLTDLLGSVRAELLARGTVALPEPVRRRLLQSPGYLLELQELVLLEGGDYWQTLPRPRRLVDAIGRSREAILAAVRSAEPILPTVKPARQGRGRLRWSVSFAAAACLLIGGFVVWQQTRPPEKQSEAVAWGWAKPGALPPAASANEYYAALAAGGEQWFNQRPDDRASLAKRLNELRQGCSVVIASDHPPLSPDQQQGLKDRCSKWAAQFDAALVRLENDEDPVAVRTDVDAVVTKLVAYLNSQRQA